MLIYSSNLFLIFLVKNFSIAFHFMPILLGKAWIDLFSSLLWVNRQVHWFFTLDMATCLKYLTCVTSCQWLMRWVNTYWYFHILYIGLMSWVFLNGLRDWVQSKVESYQTQKMVLDPALLNTQHYKVRIKGKVEQSREWSSILFYTSV